MRQTKLASSLVNFRAHYKIVWLYFYFTLNWFTYLRTPVYFTEKHGDILKSVTKHSWNISRNISRNISGWKCSRNFTTLVLSRWVKLMELRRQQNATRFDFLKSKLWNLVLTQCNSLWHREENRHTLTNLVSRQSNPPEQMLPVYQMFHANTLSPNWTRTHARTHTISAQFSTYCYSCQHLNLNLKLTLFTLITRQVIRPHLPHIVVQWLQCSALVLLKFLTTTMMLVSK